MEPPPQYAPPQTSYGPPPVYTQAQYPQQPTGFAPSPYMQPVGTQVVVVTQPQPVPSPTQVEWAFPRGYVPSILMLIVAALNLTAFIGIGLTSFFYSEYIVAFVLYMIGGVLGTIGSKKQTHSGIAIACLVFAIIDLIMAFVQIILHAISVTYAQILFIYHTDGAQISMWINVAILLVVLFAFALSISLIVITSRLLCCSRASTARTPGVMYAPQPGIVQAQAIPPQQGVVMQAQAAPGGVQYKQ